MLKNIAKLDFQVGDKVYQFLCDCDAPLEHAKVALGEFMKYFEYVESKAKSKQPPQEQSEVPNV